jgi:Arc/MetJ family transcription regulator
VATVPTSAGSRQRGHAGWSPRRRCCRQMRAGGSICPSVAALNYTQAVIFKQVGEGRPYPDHARTTREWAEVPPRPVRLDQLITTKAVLDLRLLLDKDSTFYGDLFPHVIQWRGELYLEDGLHRALGAALHQRTVLHARVLDLDAGEQAPSRRRSGLTAD